MAQCAAITREGKPCEIPAPEGKKYCHIHRRQRIRRWILSSFTAGAVALGVFAFIANLTSILGFFGLSWPVLNPTGIVAVIPSTTPAPSHTLTPTVTPLSTSTPTLTRTPAIPATPRPTTRIPDVTPTGTPLLISIAQSFPAPGSLAEGITWDGSHLWLSDNSGTIFQVDADGKTLGAFDAPEVTPQGLAWDGSGFWLYTTNYSFIYQFRIEGRETKVLHSFKAPTKVIGGDITQDLAWDGKNLWYANQYNVYRLDTTGTMMGSFPFPKNVMGLDWDDTNLWIAYNEFPANATLSVVDTMGNLSASFTSPVFKIESLAWGDDCLWAIGRDSLGGKSKVYKLDISLAKKTLSPKSESAWQAKVLSVRKSPSLPRNPIGPTPQSFYYEIGPGMLFLAVELGLKNRLAGAILDPKDILLTDDRGIQYPLEGIQISPTAFVLGNVAGIIRMTKADPPYLLFAYEIKSQTPTSTSTTTGELPAAAASGGWPGFVMVWRIPIDAKELKILLPGTTAVEVAEPSPKQ